MLSLKKKKKKNLYLYRIKICLNLSGYRALLETILHFNTLAGPECLRTYTYQIDLNFLMFIPLICVALIFRGRGGEA